MKRDARGLEVSNASERAIEAVNRFAVATVSLNGDMAPVVEAARAEPECAMLQAYAASIYVYSQSSSQAASARPFLQHARQARALSERERLFIDAVGAGCEGDFESALANYERIAARWPTDMATAKIAEFHFFETGEAERQLRFMAGIEDSNREVSHMQAMYAFALELNARRAEAEQAARRALALDPDCMWAQHCLAHVYSGDFRIDEGIATMREWAPSWTRFGQYIQSHNWFHLGTLYLANLERERALDAFRTRIWNFTPELIVEQTDAILLLWYLELAGAEVEQAMWKAIAPYVMGEALEHVFPFLNAIFIYALARAGENRAAHEALERMESFARAQSGAAARIWLRVGLPEARASLAFAEGDWAESARLFGPIIPDIACGGGSDEQRGVFSQSWLLSLIRSGQRSSAASMLQGWIGSRAPIPLEQYWLSMV